VCGVPGSCGHPSRDVLEGARRGRFLALHVLRLRAPTLAVLPAGIRARFVGSAGQRRAVAVSGSASSSARVRLSPLTIGEAKAYVARHHRHRGEPTGALFAIGVAAEDRICGVAIVGRPSARELQDGFTAEVTRLCTDGSRNACSLLYGACWRAARAMGYRRLVTYTLESETGASLRGAGWRVVGSTRAESWHRRSRPRVDRCPLQVKLRWEAPAQ